MIKQIRSLSQNKNLDIKALSSVEETIWGLRSYIGEITLGNSRETFEMTIEWWNLEDYQKQWHIGLERIKTHSTSCLVARIEGYQGNPVQIDWWLLYKESNKIIIRNQLLISTILTSTINGPFTPETCYNYIPPKSRSKKVSEWVVDLEN